MKLEPLSTKPLTAQESRVGELGSMCTKPYDPMLISGIYSFILITFAGIPTAVALSGISFVTTAPAPILELIPI